MCWGVVQFTNMRISQYTVRIYGNFTFENIIIFQCKRGHWTQSNYIEVIYMVNIFEDDCEHRSHYRHAYGEISVM